MITNLSIGKYGRLGNQMFQYALLVGYRAYCHCQKQKDFIQIRRENEIEITQGLFNPKINGNDLYSFDLAKLFKITAEIVSEDKMPENLISVKEPDGYAATFIPDVFNLPTGKNYDFHGYFQSWKYFHHCEQEILLEFALQDQFAQYALLERQRIQSACGSDFLIGVHVRRGDCVAHRGQFQVLLSPSYYVKNIELIATRFPSACFVFFSDDVDYCKSQILPHLKGKNVAISDSGCHLKDFAALSILDGILMANSSFSWWAAYLQRGFGFVPNRWWGNAYRHFSEQDIRCPNWEVVAI